MNKNIIKKLLFSLVILSQFSFNKNLFCMEADEKEAIEALILLSQADDNINDIKPEDHRPLKDQDFRVLVKTIDGVEKKVYVCMHCGIEYFSNCGLCSHLSDNHSLGFICPFCHKSFAYKAWFEGHKHICTQRNR